MPPNLIGTHAVSITSSKQELAPVGLYGLLSACDYRLSELCNLDCNSAHTSLWPCVLYSSYSMTMLFPPTCVQSITSLLWFGLQISRSSQCSIPWPFLHRLPKIILRWYCLHLFFASYVATKEFASEGLPQHHVIGSRSRFSYSRPLSFSPCARCYMRRSTKWYRVYLRRRADSTRFRWHYGLSSTYFACKWLRVYGNTWLEMWTHSLAKSHARVCTGPATEEVCLWPKIMPSVRFLQAMLSQNWRSTVHDEGFRFHLALFA